jgi:arylsulfatase A-like enzyme
LKLTEQTLVIFTSDNGPVVDDGYKTEPQLYNLARDPGETMNLAGKYPDRAQAMAVILQQIKQSGGGGQ